MDVGFRVAVSAGMVSVGGIKVAGGGGGAVLVGGIGVAAGGRGVGVGVAFLAVQPASRAKTHTIKNILRNI